MGLSHVTTHHGDHDWERRNSSGDSNGNNIGRVEAVVPHGSGDSFWSSSPTFLQGLMLMAVWWLWML
jgi:hypothetical protein